MGLYDAKALIRYRKSDEGYVAICELQMGKECEFWSIEIEDLVDVIGQNDAQR